VEIKRGFYPICFVYKKRKLEEGGFKKKIQKSLDRGILSLVIK
jgi:hypothetical protein